MTCCIIISSSTYPAPIILSDTKISMGSIDDFDNIPARINSTYGNINPIMLHRKSILITNDTIISCAGEMNSIKDFLEYAPSIIRNPIDPNRPLRGISDRASQYHSGNLNTLVVKPVKTPDNELIIHHVKPDSAISIFENEIGSIYFIGSGGAQASTMLSQIIEHSGFDHENPMKIAKTFQMKRIIQEITKSKYDLDCSWGAIFEIFYFDIDKFNWAGHPRTIKMIFYIDSELAQNKNSVPKLFNRIILQDTSLDGGGVRVLLSEENEIKIFQYDIYHFTESFESEASPPNWEIWTPEEVDVALVVQRPDGQIAVQVNSFPISALRLFQFKYDGVKTNIQFDIEELGIGYSTFSTMDDRIK